MGSASRPNGACRRDQAGRRPFQTRGGCLHPLVPLVPLAVVLGLAPGGPPVDIPHGDKTTELCPSGVSRGCWRVQAGPFASLTSGSPRSPRSRLELKSVPGFGACTPSRVCHHGLFPAPCWVTGTTASHDSVFIRIALWGSGGDRDVTRVSPNQVVTDPAKKDV